MHTRMVIEKCLKYEFDTYLSIQGPNDEKDRAVKEIKQVYPQIKVFSDITFDRAGFVGDKYAQNIKVHDKRLSGCFLFSDTLFVRRKC